ncbi:MAG: hypothetical protein WCI43_03980 [Candidatus Firestonebacteria bacterium]
MSLSKLIVIVLIAGALGFAIYGFMMGNPGTDKANIEKTLKIISHIKSQAVRYYDETGSEPVRLSVLIAKKYLSEQEALDAWGTEIDFKSPSTPEAGGIKSTVCVILSAGPDTNLGTKDDIKYSFDLTTAVAE